MLIDTRETNFLRFPIDKVLTEVVRTKLNVGDYMVEFVDGHRPPVSFERKNLSDLFGTMGKGYKRFKREMERAENSGVQLILIIEGTVKDVLRGPDFGTQEGIRVLRRILTLWVRYDLPVIFCQDREEMVVVIREFFEAIGRNYIRENGKKTVGTTKK